MAVFFNTAVGSSVNDVSAQSGWGGGGGGSSDRMKRGDDDDDER